jgi:HD-GYP domain-containing protein (c-di-GMP phosphodiesterase class II)
MGETVVASESDEAAATEEHQSTIPYHAVTALVSALAYRDPSTADHSRRVADLCVATARRLMPTSQSYVLEIAALLHDIGKIGVPDSILLKPGKLSEEEWHLMNSHERIGEEIVQSTFSNSQLAEVIRTYRAWFGGNSQHPQLPTGDDIPLSARILAIADAYDSMTNRTSYRDPLSPEKAFVELRRCAVRQFDPELVERFIDAVSNHGGGREASASKASSEASKAAALSFGTQIERLAEVLEHQDFATALRPGHLTLEQIQPRPYQSSQILLQSFQWTTIAAHCSFPMA